MKLSNSQYVVLKMLTENLVSLDVTNGLKINLEDVDKYINNAVKFSGLVIDEEDRQRLFTDIEYQFKIVHTPGKVIFDDYDNQQEWYSNDKIKDAFFWNRYRKYLTERSSIDMKSINLMDVTTLPQIMNCLSDPQEDFEGRKAGASEIS